MRLFLSCFLCAACLFAQTVSKTPVSKAPVPKAAAPVVTAPAKITPKDSVSPKIAPKDTLAKGKITSKDTVTAIKSASKDTAQTDSLQKQSDALRVKKTTVAFLGIESISENRFHETLEERIYMRLSYNKYISLEPKDFYFRLKSRGIVNRKLLTMNEAVELLKMSGDRIFVSGEIRNFRIELKRYLGFLPVGKVTGEIVCYLQVIDALAKTPRFAGDVKFTGTISSGWVGFGLSTENMPLSPIDEKNFVFELVSGMGEAFAETAESAYSGLIDQKRIPPPPKENPVRRGEQPDEASGAK